MVVARPTRTNEGDLSVTSEEEWRWLRSTLTLQTEVFGYTLPVQDPTALSAYLSWNLLAAYQELGEIGVEFSWKP